MEGKDKLFTVVIGHDRAGYVLSLREFDLATRRWSGDWSRRLTAPGQLSSVVLEMMCQAFSPLVRVEQIDDEIVTVSVRASSLLRPNALVRSWKSPVEVSIGDVLMPVIRRADRNGKVGPTGVKPIEWTVLVAEERGKRSLELFVSIGLQAAVRISAQFSDRAVGDSVETASERNKTETGGSQTE